MIKTHRELVLLFGRVPAVRLHFLREDGTPARPSVDFKADRATMPRLLDFEHHVSAGGAVDNTTMLALGATL